MDVIGGLSWRFRHVEGIAISCVEAKLRGLLRGWSRMKMNRHGLSVLISNRPASAYPPDHVDLWFLYRQIRNRKPKCVLEFGAGCSTVVLAQAVYDNHNGGHVYSVDAVPYWAETTRSLMPKHLQNLCTIITSDIVSVSFNGSRVLRHAQVPDVEPDFIYLDGPDFQDFTDLSDRAAACDPVDLEPRFKPGFCMVVDGRVENRKFLQENLKRRYAVSTHWPLEQWKTGIYEMIS